jgi:hypothetical protein
VEGQRIQPTVHSSSDRKELLSSDHLKPKVLKFQEMGEGAGGGGEEWGEVRAESEQEFEWDFRISDILGLALEIAT